MPGYEYQSSGMIQRTSRRTESRRGEASRSRESQRVGSRKNIKQKKSKGSSKVFGVIEEVYSRTQ